MPRDFDEKRDFVRITVDCKLTYKSPGSKVEETGQARNLSGRGMMFIADRELPLDSMLEVRIRPENDLTPPLHALVKVVRVARQRRGDGVEIGGVIQQILD